MLNFLHDPILITLSNVFTLVTDKKRRYHVTDDEQSLVLKSYEELNGDWEKNGRVHERQRDEDVLEVHTVWDVIWAVKVQKPIVEIFHVNGFYEIGCNSGFLLQVFQDRHKVILYEGWVSFTFHLLAWTVQ